jgi:hypothetical protein
MGREAVCTCDWAGEVTEVKALLETNELILRGGLRRKLPFYELQGVKAIGDSLCFSVDGERVELILGIPLAESWAAKIAAPPPSLAKKLGITNQTRVRTIGAVCVETLQQALNEAAKVSNKNANLLVACVDTLANLQAALKDARADLSKGIPIWIVYAKGPGHALRESDIRSLFRTQGLMDTKVASVSAKFTALRFNLRKAE